MSRTPQDCSFQCRSLKFHTRMLTKCNSTQFKIRQCLFLVSTSHLILISHMLQSFTSHAPKPRHGTITPTVFFLIQRYLLTYKHFLFPARTACCITSMFRSASLPPTLSHPAEDSYRLHSLTAHIKHTKAQTVLGLLIPFSAYEANVGPDAKIQETKIVIVRLKIEA